MDTEPRRPADTREFMVMWNAVTTDALTHKLSAVLPELAQTLPGAPRLDEAQAAALSPVLVRALQLAASPDGGVHAAVQFLGEYAANPGT